MESVDETGTISSNDGKNTRRPSTHLPTRRRRGSYLTITGKFPSAKTQHLSSFEGFRERDFFVVLDYDDEVETFRPHPLKIQYRHEGRARVYTPDVLVTYRNGPDGKPIRQHELCEVKMRAHLRKDWRKLKIKFKAAKAYCEERGWRFRIVTELDLLRPFVGALHFLRGFQLFDEDVDLLSTIRQKLETGSGITVAECLERIREDGLDADAALVQIWRLVALKQAVVDFDHPLSMGSQIRLQPWSVRGLTQQLKVEMSQKQESEQPKHPHTQEAPAGESLGSAGSAVLGVEVGGTYARTDRPGQYTVIQFDDPETVTVREHGSGVVEAIQISLLAPFAQREANGRADLRSIGDQERLVAERRLEAIKDFVDRRRISKEEAAKQASLYGVAAKTWRAWLKAYQENPVLSSLMRQRRQDAGKPRTQPLVEELIKEFVNRWLQSRDTIKSVHRELSDEIRRRNNADAKLHLACPEYTTFYNRCKALPQHEVDAHREGKRVSQLRHGLHRGSIGGVDSPLAIVQIDHTPLPVQIVDEEFGTPIGRPVITVLIDVFSRMVVGYYLTLEEPGNLSTGMAITNAMLPKTDLLKRFDVDKPWPCSGRMRILHADNAGEFHGNMLELGCKEYSIELVYRRVKRPNYGAHIESYLGTLSEKLRALPGTTLTGPDDLGDRDPQKEAVMTLDDLEKWFLWLLVEYHHSEHSGLSGQTPISRWRDGFRGSSTEPGIGKVYIPKDAAKLRLDFMPLEERVVGPRGIVWDNIWYSHSVLQHWVNARDPHRKKLARQFICRRDPRDLSRIYFWDPDRREYFVIPYRNASRPKITLWEYLAVRRYLEEKGRSEVDEDIIFHAREQRRRALLSAQDRASTQRRIKEEERRRRAAEQAARISKELGQHQEEEPQTTPAAKPAEEIEPFEDFFG